MPTFFITLLVFGLAVAAMAVGVIFSDRSIRGTCGGINRRLAGRLGRSSCGACGALCDGSGGGECAEPGHEAAGEE